MTTGPTIARRLERRCIALCADADMLDTLRAALPEGWTLRAVTAFDAVGGFDEVLLHRFILLDLDAGEAIDPVGQVDTLRREMMVNVPVFCFGGSPDLRNAARLARADRFFERAEVATRVPDICGQFAW
ncbi:MAG TPA: hypothetical protein VIS77_10190 [Burkholderiales bacterium]